MSMTTEDKEYLERMAGLAMMGLLSADYQGTRYELSARAFEAAEALLEERNKRFDGGV